MIGPIKLCTYMKLSAFSAAIVVLAILSIGCGGSSSPAGTSGLLASPGSGTGTLKVVAAAEGRDTGPGTSQFATDFRATVTDANDAPVSGANVTISGTFGTVTLLEDPLVAGNYVLDNYPGFAGGSYTLNVTSGADTVTGVRATTPKIHSITSPVANSVVTAGMPVNVTWSRSTTADESRVESRDYTGTWTAGDPGVLTIPGANNPARTDQRFGIERRVIQPAAGGLPGSQLTVQILIGVEPVISQ